MIARFRSFWLSVNASYWFYPGLFSLLAAILAFVTVYLDRNGMAEWLNEVSWIHSSRPEGARTVLTVIAGSMIAVASTVFSITIAAVAYASGNYGPRLLTNFMQDKGNQLSLGTFIATFVYALMVLRVVRGEDERPSDAVEAAATQLPGFTPQLSLLIATVLALIAVAVLVFFLHHIPDSIRINTVLKGIGQRLIWDIRERFPDEDGGVEPEKPEPGEAVLATATGYVKIIDFETLDSIAEDKGGVVALRIRTGDFIHPRKPIAEWSGAELTDEIADAIRDCFSAGGMRTPTQDLEFLFDELVEIALRALSPGINDPFTAITSMHWLGAAMAELCHRDLDRGPEQESYDRDRVQPLDDDFAHFMQRGFGGIRASAAGSAMASKKFIDVLQDCGLACASKQRRDLLVEEARLLLVQAHTAMEGPSLDELEARFAEFKSAMADRTG
ncbi:DUF2254 domain-containing protein [Parasphingopyxis marina]|uniref:DUF2254 domain-containing protein n=1 Tax=Parasphingopyxis marina TaxID=2761622 RepID=A0A842HXT1_9SPHN|nr:DUF2254 domain-containing protein [Parasphingopyxis marina]MBC2777263.1 DUF2254 domain-containing protein [Parasphingopyxis marina]